MLTKGDNSCQIVQLLQQSYLLNENAESFKK